MRLVISLSLSGVMSWPLVMRDISLRSSVLTGLPIFSICWPWTMMDVETGLAFLSPSMAAVTFHSPIWLTSNPPENAPQFPSLLSRMRVFLVLSGAMISTSTFPSRRGTPLASKALTLRLTSSPGLGLSGVR